jgi:hypothetical protein
MDIEIGILLELESIFGVGIGMLLELEFVFGVGIRMKWNYNPNVYEGMARMWNSGLFGSNVKQ